MLFDRVIRARILIKDSSYAETVREIEVRNLRMTFTINKSFSVSTNTCTLKIYNLSPENRNAINEDGSEVRLYAGYRENGGDQLLFIGNLTTISHSFSQPEIVSTLVFSDGEIGLYNTLIPVSFSAKTKIRSVIEYIAERFGLQIAHFTPTEDLEYEQGYSDSASGAVHLTNTCNALNLRWSVQNGDLYIIPNQGATDKPPTEITAFNGLIGIPERNTDKKMFLYNALPKTGRLRPGWKFKTLLRPDILPGDRIRLISPTLSINGVFYVDTILHDGDNYGENFTSNFEVYPV